MIQQRPFTIERTLRATPADVWEMWTTKDGIESWWGPEGFETTVRALELRVGGRFEFVMRAVRADVVAGMKEMGAPLESIENGTYLVVTPTTTLDFVEIFCHAPTETPDYEVTVRVAFEPHTVGTRVVIHSTGMHSERWQQMASQGWSEQLNKLDRIFAERAAS